MTNDNLITAKELLSSIAASADADQSLLLGPQAVKNLHGLLSDLLRGLSEPSAVIEFTPCDECDGFKLVKGPEVSHGWHKPIPCPVCSPPENRRES